MSVALNMSDAADLHIIDQLRESLGDYFASKLLEDAAWARSVLGVLTEDTS